eukprot:1156110-Pelagomonas_calceolata.AAC.1
MGRLGQEFCAFLAGHYGRFVLSIVLNCKHPAKLHLGSTMNLLCSLLAWQSASNWEEGWNVCEGCEEDCKSRNMLGRKDMYAIGSANRCVVNLTGKGRPVQNAHGDLEGYWKRTAPGPGCADETLPTSITEKETHWLRRAGGPFHHSGNKLVGIHNIMCIKLASKFNGTLVVKSQLLKLVKGVLIVTGPTDTQKDGAAGSHSIDVSSSLANQNK